MNQYETLWKETLEAIKNNFNPDTFSWICKTSLFRIEDGMAYVSYRSVITKNIMSDANTKDLFEQYLSEMWGEPVHIQLMHYREVEKMMPEEIVQRRTKELVQTKFNADYTFENFVQGKSNQGAYAACFHCCIENTHTFNPILIYGNSGLGKTHLLHAIGNYLQKERPEKKVFYAYSGDLVSILIDAMKTHNVQSNTVEMVQAQLIDNDYFLIDDIQNLTQSSSQEIFFKVYNSLIAKGAQIVITSDMHPNELEGIQNRLISRFNNGLPINILKPEFDTSRAILRKKLEGYEEACQINDETIDFLAHKFSDDVRKLEGSLRTLVFNATLENVDVIDLPFTQRVLSGQLIVAKPNKLTPKQIKKVVTKFYGLSYNEVEGKSRQKKLVNARHMIVYLCHETLGTSWTQIGQELGNRDHSTIKSSYDRAIKLLKTDTAFQIAMNKIKDSL